MRTCPWIACAAGLARKNTTSAISSGVTSAPPGVRARIAAPGAPLDRGHQLTDLSRLLEIGLEQLRRAAAQLDVARGLLGRLAVHEEADEDVGARLGEAQRDRAPDAAAAAGHQHLARRRVTHQVPGASR